MAMNRVLLLALLTPSAIAGQQPAAATLKPANATLKAPFVNVSSMHELSDGRVLMADLTAGIIGVADFSIGKLESIPDVSPSALMPLAGDSTLMYGISRAQWVFFLGARPIGMLPADNPVVSASRSLWGADSMGHVLGTARSAVHEDSVRIIMVTRTTAQQDTVTSVWQGPAFANDDQRPVYQAYEHALLTLDGWIAVLRRAPYRVDWRTPAGRWVLGAPIPYVEVKLDDREKRWYMIGRAGGGTPAAPETIANWPATVAPWTSARDLASPDGKLLVSRTRSADFPYTRYDVINRRGELDRQISMAADQRILGFGPRSVYVIVKTTDGTQLVERHPWP